MEIVCALSKAGMQFFMATHSYFVIKKLYLMAIKENTAVNVLSIGDDAKADAYNLQDGLPENPIVEESVRLYEEEVGVGANA